MMNKLIFLSLKTIALLFGFFSVQLSYAQVEYCRIDGTISNENFSDVIYLIRGDRPFLPIEDMEIVDSAITAQKKFSFTIPLSYTDYYSVRLKNSKKGFVLICTPGENIRLECDTSNFKYPAIFGSEENALRTKGITGRDPLILKMNSYADSASMVRKDSIQYNRYVSLNVFWANEIKAYNLRFVRDNPNSLTSLDIFNRYYSQLSQDSVKHYLHNLPMVLQKNPLAKEIMYKTFDLSGELKKITRFYDLKFYDTLSQQFSFHPYAGKLVLIDFWASWCVPCIENLPLLKNIHAKYKHKNFVIIGVSLDVNFKRWKNEIARSGISWDNVTDLKGADGLGARYFNVISIPRYVLLGKDGLVIDDDVTNQEMEKLILANL